MTTSLIFLGAIMVAIVVWLIRQTLNTTPWIAESANDATAEAERVTDSAGKFGLLSFLAVVVSFFALFVSAYAMRMSLDDWVPLDDPKLLVLNTLILLGSSVALQLALNASKKAQLDQTKRYMIAGAGLALLFIAGQFIAWRELVADGYYLQTNSSYAFFYLFTGLHALHLAGGLFVLARAIVRILRSAQNDPVWLRGTVELCTIYWHFLLVVWLGLYWLLLVT
jgi:cytochrome c oxidase subunit 3